MIGNLLQFAITACNPKEDFFGLPTWYKYLPGEQDLIDPSKCVPTIQSLNDTTQLWGIGLAVIEILLRIAGMAAVALIIYGGVQYIISGGNPDTAAKAKTTIENALIGLIIAILASTAVIFIGNALT